MPYNHGAARQTLAQLCAAHRLDAAARVLSDGSAR
jgi:hypothetical protein